MLSFSDLMNVQIHEEEIKRNIVHVLSTGEYCSPYAKELDEYIQSDIQNFIRCFNASDDESVIIQSSANFLKKDLRPSVDKIEAYIKERSLKKEDADDFHRNLNAFLTGSTLLKAQRDEGGLDYTCFYNMAVLYEPFMSLHTFYHELSHLLEIKRKYRKYWKDIHDEKEDTIETAKSEIYANAMANTILMVKALQTNNSQVIKKVKNDVLNFSSYMSNALINSGLGVAYCDWGATKKIVPELERKGISFLVQKNDQIDWNVAHEYVIKKINEMGYTPERCLEAKEKIHPELKKMSEEGAELSEILEKVKQKTSKESVILNDFIEAQTRFQSIIDWKETKGLCRFYSGLYLPDERKKMLYSKYSKNVPDIVRYRKIYALSQRKRTFLNFKRKAKSFLRKTFSLFEKNG